MWIPGVVIQVRGPVSYTMELASVEQKRRHVGHLHPRVESVVERKPDWADAVPSELTEAAVPQPDALSNDESDGSDVVATSQHYVIRVKFDKPLNSSDNNY